MKVKELLDIIDDCYIQIINNNDEWEILYDDKEDNFSTTKLNEFIDKEIIWITSSTSLKIAIGIKY